MKTASWRNQQLVLGNDTDVLLDLEDMMESRTSCFLNIVGLNEIKSSFGPNAEVQQNNLGLVEDGAIGRLIRFTRGENIALVNVNSLVETLITISEENGRFALYISDEKEQDKSLNNKRVKKSGSAVRELDLEEQIITQGIDLVVSYSEKDKAKRVFERSTKNYHKPLVWIQLPESKTQAFNASSQSGFKLKRAAFKALDALQGAWKIMSKAPLLNQESR